MASLIRLSFVGVLPLLLVLAACPKKISDDKSNSDDTKPVAVIVPCETADTCPSNQPECFFGQCARACQSNAACDDVPGTFCSDKRICEPGCRSSADCDDDKLCSLGVCGNSGECGDKCDCDPGQVCVNAVCTDPPRDCASNDDCPRAPGDVELCNVYRCDNFSYRCYDPDPAPCSDDGDCFGRVGCENGCSCSPGGQCLTDTDCTVATEVTDCPTGFFCDSNLHCGVIPACASDAACPTGLVCNVASQRCIRQTPCGASDDCAEVPYVYCDPVLSVCAVPNCINDGVSCNEGENCAADGRCVPAGEGNACTVHTDCPSDQYCAFFAGAGACAVGCRDNAACGALAQCNAAHTCVATGELSGLEGPCDDDSQCESGLVCSVFQNACKESCEGFAQGACNDTNACCALSASPCCNPLGLCSAGFNGGCL